MRTLLRASISLVVLFVVPMVVGAGEPRITIRQPEASKDKDGLEVQARSEFPCRVVVEFPDAVTWPGTVLASFASGRTAAGSFELKPRRISDRVYEFEGMVRAPAAGRYVLTTVRYDFDLNEAPLHKSKLPDGKPNPAEMIVNVRPAR